MGSGYNLMAAREQVFFYFRSFLRAYSGEWLPFDGC
jgi:hypothetical protein